MHTKYLHFSGKRCLGVLTAAILVSQSASAVDFVENFDGAALDAALWSSAGPKTTTVANGKLTFEADGNGNWNRGNILSQQKFVIPEEGITTVIEWTLGPAEVTAVHTSGETLRYQAGIISSNQGGDNPEHWPNNTGGVWMDLDQLQDSDRTSASGNLLDANDTKASASNGSFTLGLNPTWNWGVDNLVYRLEMTSVGYTWFEAGNELISINWADSGIDSEFDNGFQIFALGMRHNSGQGTTSYEKIEVTNAVELPGLFSSFTTTVTDAVSEQPVTLAWTIGDGATGIMNQEVGSIDALTTNGMGSIDLVMPTVTEPTDVPYTLTVTDGVDTIEKTIMIRVLAEPELSTESFLDHFDEGFNVDRFEDLSNGNKAYTINESKISWAAEGNDWGHGEIGSVENYPLPEPGASTVITWELGPSTVTVANTDFDTQAIRPMLGIYSALEEETYSRQHWQNTAGGLWFDISSLSTIRTDGASGNIVYSAPNKTAASNGEILGGFDLAWNWETENKFISLELSPTGFTWKDGETELASGTYAEYGLDASFQFGYGIMFSAINSNQGRGVMSLDSLQLAQETSALASEGEITNISYNADTSVTLTWNSIAGNSYLVYTSTDLENWIEQVDGVEAEGESREFTFPSSDEARFYYVEKE